MRDALTFVARAHPVARLALRDTFLTGTTSPNTVYLKDRHGFSYRTRRLGPVPMAWALELEVGHLALDHSRRGAQPTPRQGFGEDLLNCSSGHGSERFRGENLGRDVCSGGLPADFGGRRDAEVPAPPAERHRA